MDKFNQFFKDSLVHSGTIPKCTMNLVPQISHVKNV